MDTIIVKLLSDTLKFFGALLLTLVLCCLSIYATPDAASDGTPADSGVQPSAAPATSTPTYDEILAKMLNANDCYRTLSYDFYECDLNTTPEPLVTVASVWIVRKPVAMMRMVKYTGFQHQPKYIMEVVCDGSKTLAYYNNPQAGDLSEQETSNRAGHANEVITQLPGWGDVDLAVHPELLVRNRVFDKRNVTILGEEQIGSRIAFKIRVNAPDNDAPQPGGQQFYWIDTKTGIILRNDIYNNGSVKRSFILSNIALNREIPGDNFQIHGLNENTGNLVFRLCQLPCLQKGGK